MADRIFWLSFVSAKICKRLDNRCEAYPSIRGSLAISLAASSQLKKSWRINTLWLKFPETLNPSKRGQLATPLAISVFESPKSKSHWMVGCKFCSMLKPRIWGSVATAFATWLLASPKSENHCTVGFRFCSMLRPRIWGCLATAFTTWLLASPKSENQCRVGCTLFSILNPRIWGQRASTFAISESLNPRLRSQLTIGLICLLLANLHRRGFSCRNSVLEELKPLLFKISNSSSLVLLPARRAAVLANSRAVVEAGMNSIWASFWRRLETCGCKQQPKSVRIWSKIVFRIFEMDFWLPALHWSTVIQRIRGCASVGFRSQWPMRTIRELAGAYDNKAAFFLRSVESRSSALCRQYPSYSTKRAPFLFNTPCTARSGSK